MPRLPWKRNKQPTVDVQVPPEVEEYYQSTQKDRRGMAWLLAFATLVLTILIAAALFFAGRWVYRAVIGDDESAGTSQEESGAGDEDTQSGAGELELKPTLPGDDQDQNGDAGNGDDEATSPSLPSGPSDDTQNGNSVNDRQNQTPTTGPSGAEIPRTGPVAE